MCLTEVQAAAVKMEIHFQAEAFRENENYKIDGDGRDFVFN